jgi:superfamily II DNA or RNA helicase
MKNLLPFNHHQIKENIMILRPYQQDCVSQVLSNWKKFDRSLAVVPTGGGKTIIFSDIISRTPGKKLILAHRGELLQQAADKLETSRGIKSSLEKAENRADRNADVVVASIQSMSNRIDSYSSDHFDYVIVDEAHHALSDTYKTVLNHFSSAKILGVTATPDRGDKKNLGQYFENISYEIGLIELIRDKFLSPIIAKTIPLDIDLSECKTTMGDYSLDSLGTALDPYLEKIVYNMVEEVQDRKTLVFLPLIETSKKFVKICNAYGLKAAHIDGNTKNREDVLYAYEKGVYNVLSNSMLLTEGYDEPSIDCVVVLRPTKVRALYSQMVGRGTRLHEGKENLLLLDFLWHTGKHNLIHPYHLVSESPEEAKYMAESEEEDLMEQKEDAKKIREEALARELKEQLKQKRRVINPLAYGVTIHDSATYDYEPTMDWEKTEASPAQLKLLAKYKIDVEAVTSKGLASQLLNRIISRQKAGLATPSQLVHLNKYKHPEAELLTISQASVFLKEIWG